MEIVSFLQLHHLDFLVYVFFSLGMLIEGLFFSLLVMYFITTGIVEPLPAILSVCVGAMLEQGLFYYTGTRLSNFPRISNWVNRIAARFDEHIQKRTLHTLLISKFIYGFHRAILIRTGMLQLPAKQFFRASVISTSFWLLVIGSVGYYFNSYILNFAEYWSYIDLLPFILIFAFLFVERLASKYLKRWL